MGEEARAVKTRVGTFSPGRSIERGTASSAEGRISTESEEVVEAAGSEKQRRKEQCQKGKFGRKGREEEREGFQNRGFTKKVVLGEIRGGEQRFKENLRGRERNLQQLNREKANTRHTNSKHP
ncbi:Unknown protein, partial [Striga hermonthica]